MCVEIKNVTIGFKYITNKQRQAWAREHFELHHGATNHPSWAAAAPIPSDLDMTMMNSPPRTPATPVTPPTKWSQQILGHHNRIDGPPNTTLPITPTGRSDMFQYWEGLSQDHGNLHSISILNF